MWGQLFSFDKKMFDLIFKVEKAEKQDDVIRLILLLLSEAVLH